MTYLEGMYLQLGRVPVIQKYYDPLSLTTSYSAKWIHPAWGYMSQGMRVSDKQFIQTIDPRVIEQEFNKQLAQARHYWNMVDAYYQDLADTGDED